MRVRFLRLVRGVGVLIFIIAFASGTPLANAAYHFSNYRGVPPIHVASGTSKSPQGMTPSEIKTIYHLPSTGGKGTIAIIDAYDDSSIEKDLGDFSKAFNLPACTTANGCFEKHKMSAKESTNSGWALETTLDVEWAHAIAPSAKILLIEAPTPSGANFLKAIDYAAGRGDVVAVSMSFGGSEFSEETTLDSHFVSKNGAVFFASAGDDGSGASWPASSPNVIGVGGTTLKVGAGGAFQSETAWGGSGGGISAYEKEPVYQSGYSIKKSGGMRAIPDVAYDADPASGFSIVRGGVWRVVGGTSAGAPQWAAIAALGSGANNPNFYTDKASSGSEQYFRDIVSGTNGDCGYVCTARTHYDYVTGLGTPLTAHF
ncbi:MAG: S53 family peptidase [Minisyncoccia bacterium]